MDAKIQNKDSYLDGHNLEFFTLKFLEFGWKQQPAFRGLLFVCKKYEKEIGHEKECQHRSAQNKKINRKSALSTELSIKTLKMNLGQLLKK